MKTSVTAAFAAATMVAVSLASAAQYAAPNADDSGYYLGALLTRVNYKESGFGDANPTALALMGGWRMNRYFGLEARFGGGVANDSINVPGVGSIDLKIKSYFSFLVRGNLPVSEQFDLYAIAGQTRGNFAASSGGFSASGGDSSFSYGVGAEFLMGSSHSAVGVEAGRLLSGTGYDADAFSITFRHNFSL
jgi:Outer membrane protein beta-barrel domain